MRDFFFQKRTVHLPLCLLSWLSNYFKYLWLADSQKLRKIQSDNITRFETNQPEHITKCLLQPRIPAKPDDSVIAKLHVLLLKLK